ncbi:type II CRISPR RNA-guided endonuclease Cas9 [Bacillus sp. SCS-151]|uniref:type II CRISPR RNA-guided endonuclease Cas9 n=1 Tax=Nanhaiella sioensis TaxID=3115293 RepID=UPI00397A8944
MALKYRLGLSIGISSCGWSVTNYEQNKFEDFGVRVYQTPENPENGKSLSETRNHVRSERKKLRRKKHRIDRIKKLILRNGLVHSFQLESMYRHSIYKNIIKLRVDALDRELSNIEFAGVLLNLAKKRGFNPNGKFKTKENGVLINNINENKKLMEQNNYRTVAEMYNLDNKFYNNRDGKSDSYYRAVHREDLLSEIKLIFQKQREYKNQYATESFEKEYIDIWSSQRPYITKEQLEKKVGFCRYEVNERRAPVGSFTYQKFLALQAINKLKLIQNSAVIQLTSIQRNQILELALQFKKLTYSSIRQMLKLNESFRFSGLYYPSGSTSFICEKEVFVELSEFHYLKEVIVGIYGKSLFEIFEETDLDVFAYALTFIKDKGDFHNYLSNYQRVNSSTPKKGYDEELIIQLEGLNFRKISNFSLIAIKKLTPFLEKGYTLKKACEKVGYQDRVKDSHHIKGLLPPITNEVSNNHIIKRALTQTRKVVNSVVKKYGFPTEINILVDEKLTQNFNQRKKNLRNKIQNEIFNKEVHQLLVKKGIVNPQEKDIDKYKLWLEQEGVCLYSQNNIDINKLFIKDYVTVDHIIPYSKSFDNTFDNKVLVFPFENQNKGNKLPFNYFQSARKDWYTFENLINVNNKMNFRKKQNFLMQDIREKKEKKYVEDYISGEIGFTSLRISNYLQRNLIFEGGGDKNVHIVNQKVVCHFKELWGLNEVAKSCDLDHAIDAAIVSSITKNLNRKLSEYFDKKEMDSNYTVDESVIFPTPWNNFTEEIKERICHNPYQYLENRQTIHFNNKDVEKIKPVFVSRTPSRKITGIAHQGTIRRYIGQSGEGIALTCVKTPLSKIRLDNSGEFDMYNKDSDPYTYNAIKQRLLQFQNNPAKAFEKELRKPTKSGEQGPVIKSVKMIDKRNVVRYVNNDKGVVYNGDILRTDVFFKKNKYYCVPIYVIDSCCKYLPNRAVANSKPYNQWPLMDNSFQFKFSLYPNDLIKFTLKKEKQVKTLEGEKTSICEFIGYYKSIDINNGRFTVDSHDGSIKNIRIGSKTLLDLEKYQVDVLGNITKVKKEKRLSFS